MPIKATQFNTGKRDTARKIKEYDSIKHYIAGGTLALCHEYRKARNRLGNNTKVNRNTRQHTTPHEVKILPVKVEKSTYQHSKERNTKIHHSTPNGGKEDEEKRRSCSD